jgi:hypothetical protein
VLKLCVYTRVMPEVESVLKMNAVTHPFAEFRVVHEASLSRSEIFEKFLQQLEVYLAFPDNNQNVLCLNKTVVVQI